MKKKIIPAIAGFMLLSLAVVGSFSYLQSEDEVINRFTVDSNESEIIEKYTVPNDLDKNTTILKSVQIKNSGDVPCYVRVLVVPASDPESYRLETAETTDDRLNGGKDWYHEDGWDNYYYYKKILQPGETTSALFTKITVLSDLNDLNQEDAQIIVYEESNQSEGYGNYLEAFK